MYNVNARGITVPNAVIGMACFVGGLAQFAAGMWGTSLPPPSRPSLADVLGRVRYWQHVRRHRSVVFIPFEINPPSPHALCTFSINSLFPLSRLHTTVFLTLSISVFSFHLLRRFLVGLLCLPPPRLRCRRCLRQDPGGTPQRCRRLFGCLVHHHLPLLVSGARLFLKLVLIPPTAWEL